MSESSIAVLVPRAHVKQVKLALEDRGVLDRTVKIAAERKPNLHSTSEASIPRMLVPTTLLGLNSSSFFKEKLLSDIGLAHLSEDISIVTHVLDLNGSSSCRRNPLLRALSKALRELSEPLLASIDLSCELLVSAFPESYSVYKPLLLLPPNTFESSPWEKLLLSHATGSPVLQRIWPIVAGAVGATHVAVNAGIPLQTAPSESHQTISEAATEAGENILRRPVDLTPIYGDFGPSPTLERISNPTTADISSAFWVSHTQNGIHQVWAPLYTMFSRGNIREKTRMLTLPSVLNSITEGKDNGTAGSPHQNPPEPGCTAVDLYAGIGYFAFSYKKAGVSKVLCWELNPWSIEGLRRGAQRNGWTSQIFTNMPREVEEWDLLKKNIQDVDFLVFQESNEKAMAAISQFAWGTDAPPIRHVNCGFLPSSRNSWKTAIRAMDVHLGGWIHAHENVGATELETRKGDVESEMQAHLDLWDAERGSDGIYRRRVGVEHVEKVKTYAPGVLHVVFDVWVDGSKDVENVLERNR
ncbi:S-adenosyl-L-methionine-dependent methyltransferase [Massariosphaeria phaeospora]|uniref:tRNA(Phe) (4-demethylwyosine(37)-C(7)) aminocarboxypropyltransferase n=1 Tax=Massariosphaeria phaeospora TaxID=100035 RepID=A0A7C8IC61_9PLEO|nr:S-adenosyl-L-methionine-dependent methyltransferase [Massariosphaeria phaeospora]